MHKNIIITLIFFTVLHLFATAQPTGNIEQDTTQANKYLENVLILTHIRRGPQHLRLLEKAITLYEAHPFHPRLIELKGLHVRLLIDREPASSVLQLAQQIID